MEHSKPTTPWEKLVASAETSKYLRGTHEIYSRLFDGDHIFLVLPIGTTPGENDGGYYSIASALKAKGLSQ